MAVKSKSELIKSLIVSAQNMRSVQNAASDEKMGSQFGETEPRQLNIDALDAGPALQKKP